MNNNMKFSVNSICPCGSKIKYKKCCGIFHKGAIAKTALELMKSRFSAFAVGKIDYIIKTSTFQKDFDDLKSFSDNCDFKKLEILEFIDSNSEAFVTFKATIFCDIQDNSFTEKSKFIKENGKWYYESGYIL
jgi:SEC-C motif-containing protein